MRLPSLKHLRTFQVAGRHLSFKDAADELAVTASAVSHQVRNLEEFLGIPLFDRLTRSLKFTDAGAEYFEFLDTMFARLESEHPETAQLVKLRYFAGVPLKDAAPLLGVDFTHTALYVELERLANSAPNEGWERLTPIVPRPADRERLGLRAGDAAFHLERLGTCNGEPVEWRTTVIRGDRFRFVSEWTAGSTAQLRPDTAASPV